MTELISLVVHYGGRWRKRDDGMEYVGGDTKIIDEVDVDYLAFFSLQDIGREECGYGNGFQMWFKIQGESGKYVEIVTNQNVFNMLKYSKPYGLYEVFFAENGEVGEDTDEEHDDSSDDPEYHVTGDDVDSSHTSDYELELSEEFADYEGSDDDIFVDMRGNRSKETVDKQADVSTENPTNEVNDDDSELNEEPCNEEELLSFEGSSDGGQPRFPEFNEVTGMANPQLCLGMRFSNVYIFRKALKEWAIRQGFDYVLMKNTTKYVTALCKVKCGFKIHASLMRNTKTFQIKTFRAKHECPRDNINRLVDSGYIADKYMAEFRKNREWNVEAMQMKIQRELGAEVKPSKCYRAKRRAAKHLEGDIKDQYMRLYDYAETMRNANPGTMVKIQTELQFEEDAVEDVGNGAPRRPKEIVVFQYLYLRFTAQRQGYFSGLRPLIGLDGCFLKSPMGGQLLCAVARDGNENMFPLAIACVDMECKASWQWFLQLLVEDFGSPAETNWVFMSDQQKGLVEAMDNVMPGVEHRFCVRHMYDNMKLKFKGSEYKNLLWSAARAGTERGWEFHMKKLKDLDEVAYNWVMRHNPKTWARCYFSTHTKSDALQNNICESFNAYIKVARNFPVLGMCEWIRKKLMKRYHIKSEGMKRYQGDICPAYQDKLESIKVAANGCIPTAAGQSKYSVDCNETIKVVDLANRICTCRMWQITGIPCKHATSAIYKNREKPEMYVDNFFAKSVYLSVYSHVINPIPSHEEWDRTELPDIHPWIVKKPSGRPKKKRIRQADEPRNPFKVTRAGGIIKCGRCKKEGHNSRGCKAAITGETPWDRRMRKERNKRLGVTGEQSPPRKRGRPKKNPNAPVVSSSQPPPAASSSQPPPPASSSRQCTRKVRRGSYSQPPPNSYMNFRRASELLGASNVTANQSTTSEWAMN